MKKFLSMLLALSVVFTYTFGAAGSVFATTEYTAAQYEAELQKAVDSNEAMVKGFLPAVKNAYSYDKDGYVKIATYNISKAAVEAGLDEYVSNLVSDMEAAKYAEIQSVKSWPQTSVDVSDINDVVKGLDSAVNIKTKYEATVFAFKNEEPAAKTYWTNKIAKDFVETDYPATGEYKDTRAIDPVVGKLNAQQVIAQAKAEAVEDIEDASEALAKIATPVAADYKKAIAAYAKAYADVDGRIAEFKDAEGNAPQTNEEIANDEKNDAIDAEAKLAALKAYAIKTYYTAKAVTTSATEFIGNDAIYVADDAPATGATVFGVHVAKPSALTTDETKAVNAAMLDTIYKTLDVCKLSIKGSTVMSTIYDDGDHTVFTKTINKTLKVAKVYDKVVTEGNKLKNTYKAGAKVYDDAKIDAVVKAAEALVYANLGVSTVDEYLNAAASKLVGKTTTCLAYAIIETSSETGDFAKAQNAAIDKFIDAVVTYGDNKTPAEDVVYCADQYAVGTTNPETGHTYAKIKTEAIAAIRAAETYEDIEAALAAAKAELAQLLLKTDATKVGTLRQSYVTSLEAYAKEKQAFLDVTKYTTTDFATATNEGKGLINAANNEAAIKAAFEEAKKLVDAVVPAADKKAAKEAIEAQLKALPLPTLVALTDEAVILAAKDAIDAYVAIPGADKTFSYRARYQDCAIALAGLKVKAYNDQLEAMVKEIGAVGYGDVALKNTVALKDKATALVAEIEKFNEDNTAYVTAYNKEFTDALNVAKFVVATNVGSDFATVDDFVVTTVPNAEWNIYQNAIKALGTDIANATPEAIAAAKAAYEVLSPAQKRAANDEGSKAKLDAADKALADKEEAAKWTDKDVKAAMYDAAKTTSYTKPSKTSVKLTAKADMTEVKENGYTVKYRFYQKGPKKTSYKLWKTSTSGAYTFKGMKKGTHSFKVKVSVYNAEGKLVAYKYTNVRTLKIK